MAFHRLSLAQWNTFIVIIIFYYCYLCRCPFWPLLWSSSRASLPLQEQRCQSVGFTSPARGLPSCEWTEAHGCTCGWARCCWTMCLFKATVHTDYSGLTCYHFYFSREVGFINTNTSPTLTVVTAGGTHFLLAFNSASSIIFKVVALETTPFFGLLSAIKWLLLS